MAGYQSSGKYTSQLSFSIQDLMSNLVACKKQAQQLDSELSSIGKNSNLKNFVKQFLALNDAINAMSMSVNAIKSELGDSLASGYMSNIDNSVAKMSQLAQISSNVINNLSNISLNDKNSGGQLKAMATQLSVIFEMLGSKTKIDLNLFDKASINEQYQNVIGYVKALNEELIINLGNVKFDPQSTKIINEPVEQGIKTKTQHAVDTIQQAKKQIKQALQEYNDAYVSAWNDPQGKKLIDAGEQTEAMQQIISKTQEYMETLKLSQHTQDQVKKAFQDIFSGDLFIDDIDKPVNDIFKNEKSSKSAIAKTNSTGGSGLAQITKEANEADKAVQKVMYHLGNLLKGGTSTRDSFGQMPDNLTENALGTRYEKYGYGILGGGLFGVTDASTLQEKSGNLVSSTFIQSIDLSKYNMYMADTEERAMALIDFLSKLQKLSVKSALPEYQGFDQYLNGITVDDLYNHFQQLFNEASLTKEKFIEFIDEMKTLLQQSGIAYQDGNLDFNNISDEVAKSENISTRFLKMLGYQGVNVGTTSLDGFGQGSVLFDFDSTDIVGYFNTVESAISDYQKIISDDGSWVGSIEQLQQYKQNIEDIITRISESFNKQKGLGFPQKYYESFNITLQKLEAVKTNIDQILNPKPSSTEKNFQTISGNAVADNGNNENQIIQLEKQKALEQEILNLKQQISATPENPVPRLELEQALERVGELEAALERMRESSVDSELYLNIQSELQALKQNIDQLTAEQATRQSEQLLRIKEEVGGYESNGYDISDAQSAGEALTRIKSVHNELVQLQSDGAVAEEEFNQLSYKIEQCTRAIELYAAAYSELNDLNQLSNQAHLTDSVTELETIIQKRKELIVLMEKNGSLPEAIDSEKAITAELQKRVDAQRLLAEVKTQTVSDFYSQYLQGQEYSNVEIGSIREQVQGLKSDLQELAARGAISAEQLTQSLKQVNEIEENLRDQELNNNTYTGYGNGNYWYSYAAEYEQSVSEIRVLEDKVSELRNQLQQANTQISELASDKNLQSNIIDELNRSVTDLTQNLNDAQNRLTEAKRKMLSDTPIVNSGAEASLTTLENKVSTLREQLQQAQLQIETLLSTNGATDVNLGQNSSGGMLGSAMGSSANGPWALETTLNAVHDTLQSMKETPKDEKQSTTVDVNGLDNISNNIAQIYGILNSSGAKAQQGTMGKDNSISNNKTSGTTKKGRKKDFKSTPTYQNLDDIEKKIKSAFSTTTKGEIITPDSKFYNVQQEYYKIINEVKKLKDANRELSDESGGALDVLQNKAKLLLTTLQELRTPKNQDVYGTQDISKISPIYDNMLKNATNQGYTDASKMVELLAQYEQAYQRVVSLQNQFGPGEDLTTNNGQQKVKEFQQAIKVFYEYNDKISTIIKKSEELKNRTGAVVQQMSSEFNFGDEKSRENALTEYFNTMSDGEIKSIQFGEAFKSATAIVASGDGTIKTITASFTEAGDAISGVTKKTESSKGVLKAVFGDLSNGFTKVLKYVTSFGMFYRVIGAIRQGITYVKEIDTAMTELRKVTDETDATYQRFLKNAGKTSAAIGSTVSDFVNATADFARLGYNIEEASQLAKVASIYKNVGDGISDINTASESVISTMKAFGVEAEDAMGIVDRFNEVGNNFAISSVGIGEALQKSASALAAAGNNIDESIGLITAANAVVQDPDSVGTALKTLSLRLRGAKADLEDAGLETDNLCESVSTLRARLLALTGNQVDIMIDNKTFKNSTQILREMAEVWDSMTDINQAAALELMGGKRQANILSAIIRNFDMVEDVISTSASSRGSALRENEVWLDSIEGKIEQFKNATQTMWNDFISSDAIKFFVDLGTQLTKIIDSLGLGKTLLSGIAIYLGAIKKVNFASMFKEMFALTGSKSISINLLGGEDLTKEINAMNIALNAGPQKWEEYKNAIRGANNGMYQYALQIEATSKAEGNATATANGYTMATRELTSAVQVGAMKQMLLNVAITAGIMAITSIIGAVSEYINNIQSLQEEWEELQTSISNTESKINSLNSELQETQNQIQALSGKKLSFVEEEELKRLKNQNDELKRQKDIQETILKARKEQNNIKSIAMVQQLVDSTAAGQEQSTSTGQLVGKIVGGVIGAALGITLTAVTAGLGGTAGYGLAAAGMGIGSALGQWGGGKAGEAIGSQFNRSNGTILGWYQTYADAIAKADEEVTNAENVYINDVNDANYKKWQEKQEAAAALRDTMYDHLSEMQQFVQNTEYNAQTKDTLDEINLLLDKISISNNGENAKYNFLNRIFGANASPAIKKLKKQIDEIVDDSEKSAADKVIEINKLLSETGKGVYELNNQINAVGVSMDTVVDYFVKIGEFAVSNTGFDLASYLSESQENIDTLQDKLSDYQGALNSLASGSFTMSDFIDLIQKYPDLASGVDVMSESFDGLAKNIKTKLSSANQKLIDDLEELRQQFLDNEQDVNVINELINALNKLPYESPSNLRKNFLDLSNAIDKAVIAKNKYDKAMSTDPQQGYKDRTEVFTDMLKRAKRGEIGSMSPIWDAYEYLSGESFDTMQGDLKQKQDKLFEYLTTWKKMYKVDSNGNLTRTSVDSWVKYAQKKIKGETGENGTLAGVEFGFKNGKLDVNLPHEKYGEFAKTVGMSEEALRDFMEALGLYYDLDLNTPDDIKYELDKVIESDGTAEEKLNNFDQALSTLGISIDQFKGQGLTTDDLIKWHVADSQDDADKLLEVLQDYYKQRDALVDKYNKEQEEQEDKKTNPLGLKRGADGNYIKGSLGKDIIDSGFTGYTEGENGTPIFNLKDLTTYLSKNGYAPKEISQIFSTMFGESQNQDVQDFLKQIRTVVALLESEDMEAATKKLDKLGIAWDMIYTDAHGFEFEIDETSLDSVLEKLGLIQDIKSSLSEGFGFVFGNTNHSESENSNENANIENTITTTVKADTTQATQAIDNLQDSYDGLLTHMSNNKAIVTLSTQTSGSGLVNGNANINGNAYASGTWGAESSSSSLVGELGQELVVRGNRWFTVGDHGAEFQDIKKGDIIFNHKQTKSLLENGYITGRGKAHVNGNAYAHGTAYSTGSGKFRKFTASGISGNANKEAKETIDFIAYKLEEIEKYISKATAELELFLDDTTDTVKKALYYEELISKEREKQQTQSDAVQIYQLKAEEALKKIPDEFKELAQNGGLEITDFLTDKDAKIAKAIETYREWAQKAADAEVAELEAIVQISTYRVDQLNDIADDFENIVGILNKQSEIIKSGMDLVVESGQRLSNTYYEEMIASSEQVLVDLDKKREELTSILDKAVKAGDVIVGTDDWFTMANAITDVDSEIVQCATDIESFKNAIKDLHWENFGKLITEIDNVNDQLSGLYDLISDDNDVVDDLGNWTKEGYTSMALLSQQMEAAQYKTRLYEQQIAKLKEDFSKQVYSVDEYNEKMAELIGSQQDSVKAYKDAQEAIVSLNKVRVEAIKDGIQKEIDAYKELIDAKTKSLDKDKEAHEFEKDITDKHKNIATLEKQLAAMVNDNSAATVAKRKKLQADLKAAQEELDETYYEHSVDQQKQALEDEYDNFEKAKKEYMDSLDESLKDVEKVVTDSVENAKLNAESVVKELTELTATYGLEIAQVISAPWQNGATALSDYMGQFSSNTSGFIDQLNNIKTAQEQIAESAEAVAIRIINAVKKAQDELNGMSYELTINQSSNSSGYHSNSTVGSGITDHYAKGTLGTSKSGLALIDELGEELVLNAGPDGRLQYLTKGTSVIPADLTNKLMGLALDPSSILEASRPIISAPELVNNNITIDMNIAEVVHIDSVSNDTIPNLTKAIETQMDSYMKKLNNRLYCKVR